MFRLLKWLVICGLAFFGITLLLNQPITKYVLQHQAVAIQTTKKSVDKASDDYDYVKIKALSFQQILLAQLKHHDFVGVVSIPQIKMTVPISEGVSNDKLAVGAGTLRPNETMGHGNYAMAGHNMGNGSQILFGPLYTSAKVGQTAYLSDLVNIYQYKITEVKTIAPTDVAVAKNTKRNLLTMTTCNEDGTKRILVRGVLEKTSGFSEAKQSLQSLLSKNVKK